MGALSRRQAPSRLATRAALVLGTVLAMFTLLAAGQSTVPSKNLALASGPPFRLPVASMHTVRCVPGRRSGSRRAHLRHRWS